MDLKTDHFAELGKALSQCGLSAEQAACAMDKMNRLAKTVGPYSKEELQARLKKGRKRKFWKRLSQYKF